MNIFSWMDRWIDRMSRPQQTIVFCGSIMLLGVLAALMLLLLGVFWPWALLIGAGVIAAIVFFCACSVLIGVLHLLRKRRRDRASYLSRLVYEDTYLRGIERRELEQCTPEQERTLQLFASWLQVRKEIELPDYPKVLVREFLALSRTPEIPEEEANHADF